MEEAIKEAINESIERLTSTLGSIHWVDLALLRNEKYPITLEDKRRLIMSLLVERE